MKKSSYPTPGLGLTLRLFLAVAVVSLFAAVAPVPAAHAQGIATFTIWDANGDGLPPSSNLCSSGYDSNPAGVKSIMLPTATTIDSITFDLYYTSCQDSGGWEFYLNGTQIGTAGNPNPQYDCTCDPGTAKWPMHVTLADSAALTALWRVGAENHLRVTPINGNVLVSYYGASITYETIVHLVVTPLSQAIRVGQVATFDASGSHSDAGNIVSYEWAFGDGETATGPVTSHTYAHMGIYKVLMAVADDAGHQAAIQATVIVDAPPGVVTVPWRYNLPHETWNGNPTILKATVRSLQLPLNYTWNFGDGQSASGTIATEDAKYEIEATHTYPASPAGTPYVATLTVTDPSGQSGSAQYHVVVKDKTLAVETNVAIDDGLWWTHKQIQRYAVSGVAAGKWSEGYDISPTAASVLAFEIQGHRPDGNPDQNPYVETVRRGLNHLFTRMTVQAISGGAGTQSPYGNPDTNSNGLGISLASDRYTYEMGSAMMALAASGTPARVAVTGPANVIGRSYKDILTDMVDMCAWGQNENESYGARGGWRYSWNDYNSDNSATQWPVIGMEAAETNWAIHPAEFVKRELLTWLTTSQAGNGGFGYTGAWDWVNPTKTGAGIAGLNFTGLAPSDSRIQNALSFLNSTWGYSGSDGVWNNNYGMYAIMKGMRTARPEITMIGSHDWYAEFARYLVDRQSANGSFPQSSGYTSGPLLDHTFAILILTPSVATPPPVADLKSTPQQARPGAAFSFDGSASYHLDPTRHIVQYDFAFGDGTTYSETAANAPDGAFDGKTTHVYPDTVDSLQTMAGQRHEYVVTLTVTDDNPEGAMTDTARGSLTISLDNHPPVAAPGGPYIGYVNMPVTLNGVDSYDPDAGEPLYNHITKYEWELNGAAPYDYADGNTVAVNWTWSTPGTYNAALRVTDRFGATNTAWTTVEIRTAVPTQLFVNPDLEVDYGGTINLEARLTTPTGDPIAGQTIKFWVDGDQNGSFDPGEFAGTGTTDATGWAALPYVASLVPSFYPIQALFEGNDPYLPSLANGLLQVEKLETVLAYSGAAQGHKGELITLSALLADDEGNPVPGKQIAFTLGSQTATALTGPDGIGTTTLTLDQCVGSYTVDSAFAGDGYYESSADSDRFDLLNSAPAVAAIDPKTGNEGDTISASTTFADVDTCQTRTASVDWADGIVEPLTPDGAGTISASHLYKDNRSGDAVYQAKICVKDSADAETCAPFDVTIYNVAPTVGAITAPSDPKAVNTEIQASAGFSDLGVLDTHTAVWTWGDSTSNGVVAETNGSGNVTGSHTYTTPGVYRVILTVTDKDGGVGQSVFEYVVVYDPDGGFVTGGGWIMSPPGACTLPSCATDPTGRANFGFVSKYQRGSNVPTGQTEFQFQAGELNFHSNAYEWLVVAGPRAQYKGTGTINGNVGYSFMLTAIDGQVNGGRVDKFRIKILDIATGAVVYDNQRGLADNGDPTTQISGGSIVVHK